jgi:tRNA uridine 5-carboxymethylaminomethyl modification enzyme
LHLRADNADQRMTALGLEAGLVGAARAKIYTDKMAKIGAANAVLSARTCSPQELQSVGIGVSRDGAVRSLLQVLAFADTHWAQIDQLEPQMLRFDEGIKAQVWRDALYAQYLHREKADADTLRSNELMRIPVELDFAKLPGLSNELAAKLQRRRPSNLAEAERIEGMTPAALLLVLAHCRKAKSVRAVGQ